jgi:predicted alpha/beta-hydrolase family hydrolase
MQQTLARLSDRWTMHWLDGADHSFHVLKSSGRRDADVLAEMGDATAAWLARIGSADA